MNKQYHNIPDQTELNKRYMKKLENQQIETINIKCPTCGIETYCFPEHLDRAYCHVCMKNGLDSKLTKKR